MLISCWSAKGGAGATVVASSLAVAFGRRSPAGSLLVDLGGDVPAMLGLPEPNGPGVRDWLVAGCGVPADGLARLEVPVTGRVRLLHRGIAPGPTIAPSSSGAPDEVRARPSVLADLLALDPRVVVVDCGCFPAACTDAEPLSAAARALIDESTHSWLVTRPCYLALRKAIALPVRPSGVVVVREPGRALDADDVAAVLDAPVVAEVAVDPSIARFVDAGLLAHHVPASLARATRFVA